MKRVFADTFYWIALTNTHDSAYAKALQLAPELRGSKIQTSEPVLIEFLNYFAGAGPVLRQRALRTARRIMERESIEVQPLGPAAFQSGLRLYESRPDKGYSLTDCISMEMMRAADIRHVLTNDNHFQQEGFIALFR